MRDVADVMVASETQTRSRLGFLVTRNSPQWRRCLRSRTRNDHCRHLKLPAKILVPHSTSLSTIDLTKLGELDAALRGLGDVMEFADSALLAALGSARQDSLAFGDSPDPSLATNAVDLGVLMNELSENNISVRPEADAVLGALETVVIHEIEKAELQLQGHRPQRLFPTIV